MLVAGPRDPRILVSQALRNRKALSVDLKKSLEEVRGVEVVKLWTVRKRLLAAKIRSYHPALNYSASTVLLDFSLLETVLHGVLRAGIVLCSDEAFVWRGDRRRRMLPRPRERYAQVCFEEISPYGRCPVMF
ncbi:unnamed protein product [Pieris macdunnoughi]|uniref:Uncharacterized protein n=1 Tax=Pieris macdunnoughi TaxID=345717 RepID=A0A821WPP8_9NEOP|nr:unnamed protein product [Pieris macdunnoughi]